MSPSSTRLRGLVLPGVLLAGFAAAAAVGSAHAQGAWHQMSGHGSGHAAAAASASATGTVVSVDAQKRRIKLDHGPIPEFKWPAMTMEMTAAPSVDLGQIQPGSKVRFTVAKDSRGAYSVESIGSAQ